MKPAANGFQTTAAAQPLFEQAGADLERRDDPLERRLDAHEPAAAASTALRR